MEEDISGASFSDIADLNESRQKKSQTFTEWLEKMCPYYMMYGMTYDQFWNGTPAQLQHYWQKHQYEIEERNREAWMQGLYIREAIVSAFDRKGQAKYPDRPHRITEMTEEEQAQENKRRRERMKQSLEALKRVHDARKGGGK